MDQEEKEESSVHYLFQKFKSKASDERIMDKRFYFSSVKLDQGRYLKSFLLAAITLFFYSGICFSEPINPEFLKTYYLNVAEGMYNKNEFPGNIELAVDYYQKALKHTKSPKNIEWKISRCYWILANKAANPQKRSYYFEKGIFYGKKAVENDGENSSSYTWLALNIGSNAIDHGIVNSLYKRDKIRSNLQKSLDLDANDVSAYIGLAAWYFHIPNLLGGNKEKAYELINKAIKIDPNYTTPHLMKAEFQIGDQLLIDAERTLRKLISIKEPNGLGRGVEEILKAQELLNQIRNSQIHS